MKHLNKLLSVLLAVCMIATLLPAAAIPVWAAGDGTEASPYQAGTWAALQAAFTEGGYVTLTQDVTAGAGDAGLLIDGKSVTLDLNGHIIDRGLTSAVSDGYVIKVNGSGGSLTVRDSRPTAAHNPAVSFDGTAITGGVITGGNNSGNGGGIYAYNGDLTLESGTICGNLAKSGGGVCASQSSTSFVMTGGTICYNTSTGTGNSDGGGGVQSFFSGSFTLSRNGTISHNDAYRGGGVSVNGAYFIMNGGTLNGNTATSGAGVNLGTDSRASGGNMTLSGGTVSGNTAGSTGGGVCVSSKGTLTLSGGTISGNTAGSTGGGVWIGGDGNSRTTANISGGSIRGNTAATGEGIHCGTASTLKLSGAPEIQAVYLSGGRVITLDGALTYPAAKCIPVTMENAGAFTSGWTAKMGGASPANYFSSTDGDYDIVLSEGELTLRYGGLDSITDWASLQAALANIGSGTVTLEQDILCDDPSLGALVVPGGADVTIDLNGHIIDRCLTSAVSDGYVIRINSSGSLTVKDSDPHAVHAGTDIAGGVITGGNNSGNGGGVYISDWMSHFTLESGTICGNSASAGGGVYDSSGHFTLSGGAISGNSASAGGGVYFSRPSESYVSLTGGAISGNSASDGGGMYLSSTTLTLAGTEIRGNTATHNGGGAYVYSGTIKLSGASAIDSVYLTSGRVLTITGPLTYSEPIEVRMNVIGTFTSGWSTYMPTADVTEYFTNTGNFGVQLNEAGTEAELYSKAVYDITLPNDPTHGTVTADPNPAGENAIVTLTVTPVNGYKIGSVTYTPEGESVKYPGGGNGRYTFNMPAKNVTVSVTWEPVSYTVTLHQNGGTVNAGNVTKYTFGTGATLPTNVTKAECDFLGWFDNEGCTGEAITSIGKGEYGDREFWAGWEDWATVATPAISPASGAHFIGTGSVTIACATEGATIYYTTDGTLPSTGSAVYSAPVSVSAATTVKAIAVKEHMKNSAVASESYTWEAATYTLSVTAPAFDEAVEEYAQLSAKALTITSSGNSDAEISSVALGGTNAGSFTLNKTDGVTVAAGGTDDSTYTVRPNTGLVPGTYAATVVVTYNDGATASAALSFTVRAMDDVAMPTFSPAAGSFSTVQTITISCATDGASIYYTADDTTPTKRSALYTGAITFDESVTLKAIAVKDGMRDSAVASASYVIEIPTYAVTVVNGSADASPVRAGTVVTLTADDLTGHVFAGWTTEDEGVRFADATSAQTSFSMPARDVSVTATYEPIQYSVTWKDGDGYTIASDTVAYGVTPVFSGATPTKTSTAALVYTFGGRWDPAITAVTGDAVYTALFTEAAREYTITWKNDDGSTIGMTKVAYGATPTHADPEKAQTQQYSYAFAGWRPALATVTKDAVYTATFTPTLRKYNVTFVDYDGTTVLKEAAAYDYGTAAADIAKPADPARADDEGHRYAFAGWSPALAAVTADAVYTAAYTPTVRQYTVTFQDYDGTVLKEATAYDYGTAAEDIAKPADPTRADGEGYRYTFAGWSPALAAVTKDTVYTAAYAETALYTVTWKNYDGTVLKTEKLTAGSVPSYGDTEPAKPADESYTYSFTGWDPEPAALTADAVYTAKYCGAEREYTIVWKDGNGETLHTQKKHFGDGLSWDGPLPTKAAEGETHYVFTGWTDGSVFYEDGLPMGAVRGDTVFTPVFEVGYPITVSITDNQNSYEFFVKVNNKIAEPIGEGEGDVLCFAPAGAKIAIPVAYDVGRGVSAAVNDGAVDCTAELVDQYETEVCFTMPAGPAAVDITIGAAVCPELTPGTPLSGTTPLLCSFTPETDGIYRLTAENTDDDLDLALKVYDPSGSSLTNDVNDPAQLETVLFGGKTYYVYVETFPIDETFLPRACSLTAEQVVYTPAAGEFFVAGADIAEAENHTVSVGTGTAVLTVENGSPVLTLTDFVYSGAGTERRLTEGTLWNAAILYNGCYPLTVRLEGASSVTAGGTNAYSVAVYSGGALTFDGSGTLDLSGSGGTSYALGIYCCGTLSILGGTVTAVGGEAVYYSYGVRCHGDLRVSGGSLTATAGAAEYSYGVYCDDTLTLDSGRLIAAAGDADICSYAVYCDGDTLVRGGTLEARSGEGEYSIALYTEDNLTVSGGKLRTVGSGATYGSYGVFCCEDITLSGGTLEALGGAVSEEPPESYVAYYGSFGVFTYRTLTVGSELTATGDTRVVYGSVANSIPGAGCADPDGAGDWTFLPTRTEAAPLQSDFRIVRFRAAVGVTFLANDGTDASETQTVPLITETALRANSFTRTGYDFAGWNTKPDGSGTAYRDGQNVTLLNDLTLYAQWKTAVCKVTWRDWDGSLLNNADYTYGQTPRYLGSTPEKAAASSDIFYAFIGWTDGETTYASDLPALTGDVTYTAAFSTLYRITVPYDDAVLYDVDMYQGETVIYPENAGDSVIGYAPAGAAIRIEIDHPVSRTVASAAMNGSADACTVTHSGARLDDIRFTMPAGPAAVSYTLGAADAPELKLGTHENMAVPAIYRFIPETDGLYRFSTENRAPTANDSWGWVNVYDDNGKCFDLETSTWKDSEGREFQTMLTMYAGETYWLEIALYERSDPGAVDLKAEKLAYEPAADELIVGGVDIVNAADRTVSVETAGVAGGTAVFSVENGNPVLTLTDFVYSGAGAECGPGTLVSATAISYTGGYPLTVRLAGTNSVTLTDAGESGTAILAMGDLCFIGTGTLTVKAPTAAGTLRERIGVFCQGRMSVSGCTVTAEAGEAQNTYGVGCYGLTVRDGTLNAVSKGTEHAGSSVNSSYCLYSYGDVTLDGGTLHVSAGDGNRIYALFCSDLTVRSGTLAASAGLGGSGSIAVCCDDLTLLGGEVTAVSAGADDYCCGVSCNEDLTVRGGTLTATSGAAPASYGVTCLSLTLSGGTLCAASGDANNLSVGLSCTDGLTVSGGTLRALGGSAPTCFGLSFNSGAELILTGGTLVSAGGKTAVAGKVRSSLAGAGCANADGTGEWTAVEASEEGQDLSAYRRLRFPGTVNVTFLANDGADTAAEQQIPVGTQTQLLANAITRARYEFTGWNTAADGSGDAYSDGADVTLLEDLTLYAQWIRITSISAPENTTKDGAPACRVTVYCESGQSATVYAAHYDANDRFLGIAGTMTLQQGEENAFTVLRKGAVTVRFFVLADGSSAPLCAAVDAPALSA